jgi:fructokinase
VFKFYINNALPFLDKKISAEYLLAMMKKIYLGLDIGGTKIEGAVAELHSATHSFTVFSKKRIAVATSVKYEDFLLSVIDLIKDLINDSSFKIHELNAIGIGLPGSLDPESKIMLNGNTRFLIGKDFVRDLKENLGHEIVIHAQNDANLFALSEAWGGAGVEFGKTHNIAFKKQIALGLTLGTGVGGGLSAFGKIFNGVHGSALEVGHISLNPNGDVCYCGQKGCAERYLSGTALNLTPGFSDAKSIFDQAALGDKTALLVLEEYRRSMIHFLSILNNLFNPHYFVFGGGLSNQKIIFENLKEDLSKNIFLSAQFCPEIYINRLGDSSGLFGAMIYAHENINS